MRFAFIYILTLFFALGTFGQDIQDNSEKPEDWSFKTAKKIIKFSPLEAFSYLPRFGADVEVFRPGNKSIQFGAAIVPPMFQVLTSEDFGGYDNLYGYKFRVEGRSYFEQKPNVYIGFNLNFRHLIIKDEVAVGMEGTTGEWGQRNYAYFIDTPMRFHRFTTHFEFKVGYQKITAGNMAIDLYTGISYRSTNVQSRSKIPEGGEIPPLGNLWRLEDNFKRSYPTPIIGFKIGFLHKKKG